MHVTKLELENIKAYAHETYEFERGITAITGENGAGKTTILEAIAWALFDTLEYSKDDFLRRGAKKGSVRVTFESDIDERQYSVYRDTANGYYVYDPDLGVRIAEKKADVSATLRKLLGIEPGTDIKSLFTSAIGVPQGTFTADFLRPAAARKASFDKLLKVEEYREGAERLRETVGLIRDRTIQVRERIAGAEGQLARYDDFVAEHKEASALASELSSTLAELQDEISRRDKLVAAMERAETLVTETRSRADRLEVARDASARRVADIRTERDAASNALARQHAVEADHKAHLAALDQLRNLEAERVARDKLRAEADNVARLLLSAKGDMRRLEESLARAVQAASSVEALRDDVAAQEELERERERLRDLRAEALSARERLKQLDAELNVLRRQLVQTRESAKEAEKGRGAQEQIDNLHSERIGIETSLSTAEKAATSLRHLTQQRQSEAREAERLRREVAAHEKEIVELEKRAARASEAGALTLRESELTEQLAHLRAELSRDEKFHREVQNGLCPILSERCLNIGEDQSLEDYFRDQFTANNAQLGALEQERATVNVAVREAREAEKHSSKLENVRAQFTDKRQLLTARETTIKNLDKDIAALPDATLAHLNALRATLSGIDGELINLREAVIRYAELKPLQQRLQEIEQEGMRRKEERAIAEAAAEAANMLEQDIKELEARLRTLGDPRGRVASLRVEAESATARQLELAGATDAARALEGQAQTLDAQLAQYKELDARWDEARTQRDSTLNAHREYLASEQLAATLPAREKEFEKATEEALRAALEAESARRTHDEAVAAYNRDQHSTERAALNAARERAAATSAQLTAAQSREATLNAEIARLSKIRDEMREEFRAKERLEDLNETTEFIRDTLKAAGPLVTESYLYNISIEANQLFRDVTGEAGRTLRWSRDYEIMLEEEGHERSFQNLSGGEQMAAALAVRLALLKQLSDIRLAFFDEPTTNMDAERRERLAQQIGEVKHFDQLFVISHDDTFEESVDHIIHVTRKGQEEAVSAEA
jgi:exonuclease SbcC